MLFIACWPAFSVMPLVFFDSSAAFARRGAFVRGPRMQFMLFCDARARSKSRAHVWMDIYGSATVNALWSLRFYRLESTNLLPSMSLKMAAVPQSSCFGSFSNSTPCDFRIFAVANTSSHQNAMG